MSINHAQLRAFHAVADAGGFTRAATLLHVSQPTLSAQVGALEAAYGVRLLERRGRKVAPTELGRALLDLTRRLFALEAEAEDLLAASRGLKSGHLRVGADAPYHIIAALAAFGRRYPGVRLSLATGNSDTLLHDLLEHRIDVAVIANVPGDPRLDARPLRHDRLVAFVDRQHSWARRRRPVELAELTGHRLVLRESGSTTRRLFEAAMARAGLAIGEVLEIGSREAVREAVAAGLGIGIVAQSELGDDRRLVRLALAGRQLDSVEYLVCLAPSRELRLVRAFLEIVGTAGPA
ncbi:MAG: LysR substrate-binding domain-containing protein [Dongiaceae bacterium]